MTVDFLPCPNPKVPQPDKPFHHTIEIQPRFNDFDLFGHVNNASYVQYLDVAKLAYFEAVLGFAPSVKDIAAVIVNVNASFYSPTYPGEKLNVATCCKGISRHSFTIEQRVYNPSTGDIKCIAVTIMAAFDPATATSTEVTPLWRECLTSFEQR